MSTKLGSFNAQPPKSAVIPCDWRCCTPCLLLRISSSVRTMTSSALCIESDWYGADSGRQQLKPSTRFYDASSSHKSNTSDGTIQRHYGMD
jgi:hypothetical protein